jgi:hypothetical protein
MKMDKRVESISSPFLISASRKCMELFFSPPHFIKGLSNYMLLGCMKRKIILAEPRFAIQWRREDRHTRSPAWIPFPGTSQFLPAFGFSRLRQ